MLIPHQLQSCHLKHVNLWRHFLRIATLFSYSRQMYTATGPWCFGMFCCKKAGLLLFKLLAAVQDTENCCLVLTHNELSPHWLLFILAFHLYLNENLKLFCISLGNITNVCAVIISQVLPIYFHLSVIECYKNTHFFTERMKIVFGWKMLTTILALLPILKLS